MLPILLPIPPIQGCRGDSVQPQTVILVESSILFTRSWCRLSCWQESLNGFSGSVPLLGGAEALDGDRPAGWPRSYATWGHDFGSE